MVAIQLEAKNKFKVYQSGEPVIKNDHISRWEAILKSLNAELKNAVQAFNEIKANFNLPQDKADLNTKFFSVPRTKTYINGSFPSIYFHVYLFKAIRIFYFLFIIFLYSILIICLLHDE